MTANALLLLMIDWLIGPLISYFDLLAEEAMTANALLLFMIDWLMVHWFSYFDLSAEEAMTADVPLLFISFPSTKGSRNKNNVTFKNIFSCSCLAQAS